MKILYGVNGEGMGHATRSTVVARHLVSQGHDVQFAINPGRAAAFLEKTWPGKVVTVNGLNANMSGNRVAPLTTLLGNVAKHSMTGPWGHMAAAWAVRGPDVVVSDFEPWTARYASVFGKPLIAVDNIHFMNRFKHDRGLIAGLPGDRTAAALMHPIVSNMVPLAKRYLVTSFAEAPVAIQPSSLHLPILRPELLDRPTSIGSHVVAYLNDKADHKSMIGALQGAGGEFHVYGPKIEAPLELGNGVTVFPMSPEGFMADLASSRAVIGGAGFTLMTEAIYLGKPMLAMPFAGQFEQILNANYLERLGYGDRLIGPLTPEKIGSFLERAPGYRSKLAALPKHDRNTELLSSLDRAILEVTS